MSDVLVDREILLGVSGGVAAWKSADLCSRLVKRGAKVSVILTESAREFIGPATFEALTGRPVHSQQFRAQEHFQGEHIGLAYRAELAVVAPATARTLARMAMGLSDDLLSTTLLVCKCPVLAAPAMNCDMWDKPAVQRNVKQLQQDGVHLVGPCDGWLSCGRTGMGRMAEPGDIVAAIERILAGTAGCGA